MATVLAHTQNRWNIYVERFQPSMERTFTFDIYTDF